MRSRIAVDSMVSKIDHTPLLMGRDESRAASNAGPSDRGASGDGVAAGAGAGEETGAGEAAGTGEGVTSWAAAADATATLDRNRRTGDLKAPWAHVGALESCASPFGYELRDCTRTCGKARSG